MCMPYCFTREGLYVYMFLKGYDLPRICLFDLLERGLNEYA